MKKCTICKEFKSLDNYTKDKRTKTGLDYACRPCKRTIARKYKIDYPERIYAYNKKWAATHKDQRKKANLKSDYGLDLSAYNQLLTKQLNSCAICLKSQEVIKKALCVDHDHKTGRIRGLLCDLCNRGLGHFFDNECNLERAVEYLRRLV